MSSTDTTPGVAELVSGSMLRPVYQPIVDLDSSVVVGFEALARGPASHPLQNPDALFAAARAAGCVDQLDHACQRAALDGARSAGLAAPSTLFVNVEPESADGVLQPAQPPLAPVLRPRFPVVVEITERAMAADPVALLRMVDRVRAHGWGVAVDDVGAEPASLALLPLLRPDVVKLDLRLIQQRPSRDVAQIFNAVHAECERSGTTILAEGIETEHHRDTARAFGATLGQGWLLGRPAPLAPQLRAVWSGHPSIPLIDPPGALVDGAPFDVAARGLAVRLARKRLLIEVSRQLERQADQIGDAALVVAALQHARYFTARTRELYEKLAGRAAFVGVLGEDIVPQPAVGIRGGNLASSDPLRREWDVAVLGPHFAAALVARDLGDDGPDVDRRFEFIVTHDRDRTVAIAQALLARIAAA